MRILLTGGSGFIGRHVLASLDAQKHEVMVIERAKPQDLPASAIFCEADLFSPPSTWAGQAREFRPDALIHMAWSGLPDYSLMTSTRNYQMSLAILEQAVELGCRRVFFAGTCYEYGDLRGAVAEEQSPSKLGVFAATKAALNIVASSFAASKGVEFLWGRLFFVYGVGQRESSLIPHILTALSEGREPDIRCPGAVNDFINVVDAADAIVALVSKDGLVGEFNIGSGVPLPISEVILTTRRLMRRPAPTSTLAETGRSEDGQGFWAETKKIRAATGWSPKVTLEQGIRAVMRAKGFN